MSHDVETLQGNSNMVQRAAVANRLLAAWLLLDVGRCAVWFSHERDLSDAITATGLLLLVVAVWRRPLPRATLTTPWAWSVTLGSLVVPLLYFAVPSSPDDLVARALRIGGAALFWWSAWSLRECFSVLPQSRRLVTTGAYRWIRHPMYLAYLGIDATYWLPNGDALPRGIWLLEAALLCARAALEERCMLVASPLPDAERRTGLNRTGS